MDSNKSPSVPRAIADIRSWVIRGYIHTIRPVDINDASNRAMISCSRSDRASDYRRACLEVLGELSAGELEDRIWYRTMLANASALRKEGATIGVGKGEKGKEFVTEID